MAGTRRALLGAGLALAAPAVAAPGPDAPVLRIAAACEAAFDEADALSRPYYGQVEEPPRSVRAKIAEAVSRSHDLRYDLGEQDATTLPGWQAKARILLRWLEPEEGEVPEDSDQYLAWSLCRDLVDAPA
jgi:hypothetical protein